MRTQLYIFVWTCLLPLGGGAQKQYGVGFTERGVISYYPYKSSRITASGETFDSEALVAGHKKIPFNSLVKITNLNNGKMVVVRVNDRGPYAYGRIMDISEAAARKIELLATGTAKAEIEVIGDGSPTVREVPKPKEKEVENPRVTASNESSFITGKTYNRFATQKFPEGFTHQVGSFNELSRAIEHCQMLEYRGFKNEKIFIYVDWVKYQKVYKVLIGEFGNKEAGDALKQKLITALGTIQLWTRPFPKQ
jgi:rare lipoprotein A